MRDAPDASLPLAVVHYGLGPIGLAAARLVAERSTLESVGAVDIDAALEGRTLADVAGIRGPDVRISANPAGVLQGWRKGVVLHCTGSSLASVLPQLMEIVEAGWSVVSTCEELSFPWANQGSLARRLDAAALASGVSILGTGVNPGFAMDYLPVVLAATSRRVDAVAVHRVQDAAVRRLPLQRKVGAGITVDEFRRRANGGQLGHVGLRESAHALAAAFGWTLTGLEETLEPVVAERRTPSGLGAIEAGRVTGIRQTARGAAGGRQVIDLTLEMAVGLPGMRDEIRLRGDPDLELLVPGGLHGDVATAAIVVNAIPRLVRSSPGLRVMTDLPPPHP